jgi:hypothetical protein
MEQDKKEGGKAANDELFYYKDSGIEERHGRVPPWLWAVAVALMVWGIYYLVAYWSPPA